MGPTPSLYARDNPSLSCNSESNYTSNIQRLVSVVDPAYGDLPSAGLADLYSGPVQILLQPLVMLYQAAHLQVAHRLLVWTCVHGD